MAELPGKEPILTQIFGKAAVYDFILAPLAIVGSAVLAYEYAYRHQWGRAWLMGISSVCVLVAGNSKAAIGWFNQRAETEIHELEGCLHTLHAVLMSDFGADAPQPNLRITIYRPVNGGQQLEQILDYVGRPKSKESKVGRRFPAQCGIIGMALREKKPIVAERVNENHEAFIQELIRHWSYTEADARKANPAVFSWMAIPLTESGDGEEVVQGIVYLDSTERGFFTTVREQTAKAACGGIARFVSRRYS